MEISQQASYRMPSGAQRIAWLIALVLALLPLALFILLGSHSRLASDDFCHLISGQAFGPLGNVLYWRYSLNGSYSYYFLHGLTAPLDTLAPSAFVVIIIGASLFGLVWLIAAGHRLAGRERPRLAPVIILGSTLVALSINGLLDPLPIYWFSAAARHTLPIAILLIALAAGCELIPRIQSLPWLAVVCAFFTLLAFANAGMAETFALLQLTLLASLLPLAYTVLGKNDRRNGLALLISGCAGNAAALVVILTAPGIAKRMVTLYKWWELPQRSPSDLMSEVLEHIQFFFTKPELNAAFIGMIALCLFLILAVQRPVQTPPIQKPFQLAAPPLLFCALAQALLLPLLWSQQSDYPIMFGRPAFTVIVGIQMLLPLCLAAILLARQKINAALLSKSEYWAAIPALTLAVVFLLFGLTQNPKIDWRASFYCSYSIYSLLFVLLWQFHSHLQATTKVRFFAALVLVTIAMCASVLALVVVNEVMLGSAKNYTLSFVSFAFAFSGFLCGIALALGLNQVIAGSRANWQRRAIMIGSALVVVAIWFGMMQRNVQSIPSFEEYSRAWDERHTLILAARDEGERLETLPRLIADNEKLSGYFTSGRRDYWEARCASDEITALLEERYRA